MLLFATCGFLPTPYDLQNIQCDGIELRLDLFHETDLEKLPSFLSTSAIPVMLTIRHKDHGGMFSGSKAEIFALLVQFVHLHPAWIDVEWETPNDFRKKLLAISPKLKLLSSFHDIESTPKDIDLLFSRMQKNFAHSYKIASFARSTLDALRLLLFAKKCVNHSVTCMGMGAHGCITRILSPVVGNAFCFAPLSLEKATAKGQISIQELVDRYRIHRLNSLTHMCALIGHPVEKSLGDILHNRFFVEQNINAVYVKCDLLEEELPSALQMMKDLSFRGLSVTMPLKIAILPLLDELTFRAKQAHAVNTIFFFNEKSIGDNTDGLGALAAISKHMNPQHKRVVLLGAGGVAHAIADVLSRAGAFIEVRNHNLDKAQILAKRVGGCAGAFSECHHDYDLLINCLPDTVDVPEEWLAENKYVMDCTYVPKETLFLARAVQKGCKPIYGYEMFLQQALLQERRWFSDVQPHFLSESLFRP